MDTLELAIGLRRALDAHDLEAARLLASKLERELTERRLRAARLLAIPHDDEQAPALKPAVATLVDDLLEKDMLEGAALTGPPAFTFVVSGELEGESTIALNFGGNAGEKRRLLEWLLGAEPNVAVIISRLVERFEAVEGTLD